MIEFKIVIAGQKPTDVHICRSNQELLGVQRLEYLADSNSLLPFIKLEVMGFDLGPINFNDKNGAITIQHKEHVVLIWLNNTVLGIVQKFHLIADIDASEIFAEITYPEHSLHKVPDDIMRQLQGFGWLKIKHGKLTA